MKGAEHLMTIIHTFFEGFCCVIPCPLGLIILAIPPFILTVRRRKAAREAARSSEDAFTTKYIQEA